MNQEIKKRWVKWLRENPDKQGHGELVTIDGCYCVLGALCYVIDPDNINYYCGFGYPPNKIFEEAELPSRSVKYKNISTDLVDLNDREKLSFPELANLIEEQL